MLEVALVGGCDSPPGGDRGGGDDPIVGSDVLAGRGELRPDTCMDARSDQIERERREGVQCRLHDLRHTTATKMAEAGVPESTMLAIMGHMSRAMLEM